MGGEVHEQAGWEEVVTPVVTQTSAQRILSPLKAGKVVVLRVHSKLSLGVLPLVFMTPARVYEKHADSHKILVGMPGGKLQLVDVRDIKRNGLHQAGMPMVAAKFLKEELEILFEVNVAKRHSQYAEHAGRSGGPDHDAAGATPHGKRKSDKAKSGRGENGEPGKGKPAKKATKKRRTYRKRTRKERQERRQRDAHEVVR